MQLIQPGEQLSLHKCSLRKVWPCQLKNHCIEQEKWKSRKILRSTGSTHSLPDTKKESFMHSILDERVSTTGKSTLWRLKKPGPTILLWGGKVVILIHWAVPEITGMNQVFETKGKRYFFQMLQFVFAIAHLIQTAMDLPKLPGQKRRCI